MKHILLLFSCFIWLAGNAQEPTFEVSVSRNPVTVNQQFTITFEFSGSGNSFTPPNNLSENFRVLSGPNTQQSMSFINGKMSSSVGYSYALAGFKKGVFTIASASIKDGGTTYKTKPVKIKVLEPTVEEQQAAANNPRSEENQRKALAKNLYVKLEVSKTKLFQGEQLVATYKLYNRARLVGIEGQRLPEFDGFYTNEIEIKNNNRTREQIGNVVYDVYVLKKTILIPQRSGKLNLIPLEVDAQVQIQDSKPVNTWFGPQYRYKNITVNLKSNPVTINVKPLPSKAPADFSGAVGQFTFKVDVTPSEVNLNDAVTFNVKINGKGNLPLIDVPSINWPQEFEVYDPKLSSRYNNVTGELKGSKSWEYLTIARAAGEYQIPPISFVFFNPLTELYEKKTVEFAPIKVNNVAGGNNTGITTQINKQNVSRIGTDIRFIHTMNANLKRIDYYFFGSFWFYLWLIVPIILGIGAYLVIKQQNDLQSDVVSLNKRKATKMAKQHLKLASKSLAQNKESQFYKELSEGLFGYLKNKFNLGTAELNKSHIERQLMQAQVPSATIKALLDTLDYCEMARFAPQASVSNAQLLQQAEEIIVTLENEIK